MPRSNVEIVFAGYLDAIRRGDRATMAAHLHPDVVHAGLRPEWACNGREEVLDNVERLAEDGVLPTVDALELVAAGDTVVLSVRGPTLGVPLDEDDPPRGQVCVVFTLADGLIVRMQDHQSRADALAAAGAASVWT